MRFQKTLLILALASAASMANATMVSSVTTVLTFDGLADDVYTSGLASWDAMLSHNSDYAVSGDSFLHGAPVEVVFSAPVVFEGAYYNSWGGAYGGYTFDLYKNDSHVFRGPEDTVPDGDMYWLSSGYSGQVDRIVFHGSSDGAVVDNLTYTAAVPEPESYALLLAGLGLLGAVARRRKAA